jgi:hypothetical protein
MKIYNDPLASGGRYIGTDEADGDETSGPPAVGVATYTINVPADGDYILSCLVIIPPGDNNSFWVRIADAATDSEPHASGWMRWNEIPDGDDWHWVDVFNSDAGNQTVKFTLTAGDHTLEIAHREGGAKLDVVAVTAAN